jgi:hypothetical protein
VWALSPAVERAKPTSGCIVRLIPVRRYGNRYLQAQQGLFSIVKPNRNHAVEIPALDDFVRVARIDAYSHPLLWKFTLPLTEVRALIRVLKQNRVTGATVFPDGFGAGKAVREWAGIGDP